MVDVNNVNPILQSAENKAVNRGLTKAPYPYVTGLELKADIRLGDLVLNTIDADGVVWVCTDIEGWWNHPEPIFNDLQRGLGDGSYDVRGRYSARILTLSGVFLTPDASYVQAARDKLAKAADLVYSGTWLVASENPDKAAWVRLSGQPKINTVNARGRTEFTIGLKAGDPIKYEWFGDPLSYDDAPGTLYAKNTSAGHSGTITVVNKGNVKVPVAFEVSKALSSTASAPAKIKNVTRNETIEIVASQTNSDVLSIDTYNREVLFNDSTLNARSRVGILAEWIYLDPGENVLTFEDTSNSSSLAECAIFFRSGWIA
jgi:phage-related protein